MNQKILVAYASRAGSTAEVAREIGDALAAKGFSVDVLPVRQVKGLSPYRAFIVGSAIRAGKWQPEAVRFVTRHHARLAAIPTAYFTVCLTAKEKTAEACQKASAYLEPVRLVHRAAVEGYFAGRMDYSKLGFLPRAIIKKMKVPEGDFLDRPAVRAWAEEAAVELEL